MPNHRQSVRSIPYKIQPFLLQYSYHMAKEEYLGFLSRPLLLFFIKNTDNMVKIGTYMVLSRPFRFLSRPLHFSV